MIRTCVMSQTAGVSSLNRRESVKMAGRLFVLLITAAVMIAPLPANAEVSLSQGRQGAKAIPGRFIVKYKKAGLKRFRDRQAKFRRLSDRDLKNVFNKALGSKRSKELQLIEADLIEAEQHNIDINTASLLYSEDVIEFIEPDYELTAQLVPNDPSFKSLWGLHNTAQSGGKIDADIDGPEAWDLSTGSSTITVAVIDSGVDYNHPDLAANIWKNTKEIAGNGIDDDRNGRIDDIVGWDFANNDAAPLDDHGHGTHVAGTIAAVGNNGIGVVGVSWRSKIMPLKCLGSSGSGSSSNAVLAIDYAVNNGAKVINASWGNGVSSSSLDAAIARAESKGVLFVAAAGNYNNNNDTTPFYPASVARSNVISVAASDSGDNKASYSNYGATQVDLAAPGSNIYSTTKGGGYGGMSGTSMATPHVAGAAALIWSRYPTLTFLSVKAVLLGTVDKLASFNGKTVSGGRLNLFRAMGGTSAVVDPGPNIISVTPIKSATAVTGLQINFNEAMTSVKTTDIVLTNPSNQIIPITSVVANSSTLYTASFAAQSGNGTYKFTIGPNALDTVFNKMDQDKDGIKGEVPADAFASSFAINNTMVFSSGALAIPIADRATATSTINVGSAFTISDLNVSVTLKHTFTGDLKITLFAPNGTSVVLSNRRGGGGDNMTGTIFDDEALTAIGLGRAPFSGSFKPDAPLSGFDGKSSAGTWRLEVYDGGTGDKGILESWTLRFNNL